MNNKGIACDKCGIYYKGGIAFLLTKKKDGTNENSKYCQNCLDPQIKANISKLGISVKEPIDNKPVSQEEFDKLLDACINTPPLRLKDLKAKLKKEREEKKRRNETSSR